MHGRVPSWPAAGALGFLLLCIQPGWVAPQVPESVVVALPEGETASLRVSTERGYAVVPLMSLEPLGWESPEAPAQPTVTLRHRTGLELGFRAESPFVLWDGQVVQLVEPPFWDGDRFLVPLQLAVDLLPGLLPDAYTFDESRFLLLVEGARPPGDSGGLVDLEPPTADADTSFVPPRPWSPGRESAPIVVIIDPGHGGADSGVVGISGMEEKSVALAVGLALARVMARNPEVDVRLTRDRDSEVPLSLRGRWAAGWKGNRRGVFLSLHANADPERVGVRGFETYFFAPTGTGLEMQVAAVENAARTVETDPPVPPRFPTPSVTAVPSGLDFQEASAALAQEVQRELSGFHSGPDRGVRRAPFEVLAEVPMPAVLVEVGFVSNPEEERLLGQTAFHREVAQAVAVAVERFLQQYPDGAED